MASAVSPKHVFKTIVMVTHDPRAADHAARQLYFDKGKLPEARAAA